MPPPSGIKVFIRNLAGEYLAGEGDNWWFTAERDLAHVFDYEFDQVPAQLEDARRDFDVTWIAFPVDESLIGETCDICGQRMLTTQAIFDGKWLVCSACHSK